MLRLNCGRNAVVAALRDAGAKKVYLPYYNCNTVYDAVTRAGYAEPGPVSNVYLEGETVLCPKCWTAVEVTRRAALRRGRTCQVLQAEVVNVDAYTAVL